MDEHLSYTKHTPAGRNGGNSRNGTRSKTVITEIGLVDIELPRDRDSTFEPATVKKRQRRLNGVDSMVISLIAKGLTTGEVQAHLAETYGTDVSRETISKITDRVLDDLAEWQNRPLGRLRVKSDSWRRRGRLRRRVRRTDGPIPPRYTRATRPVPGRPPSPTIGRSWRWLGTARTPNCAQFCKAPLVR